MGKILAMGAEAQIVQRKDSVSKKRIKKNYRISKIDLPLRKRRTKSESKLMKKAGELIPCPEILKVGKFTIDMEFIEGPQIKDILDDMSEKDRKRICERIGKHVNSLHKYHIIHGDLTTSNMILKGDVYLIDFGLGFVSRKAEDKAVDLLLLKRALLSKHPDIAEECFSSIKRNYKDKEVLERLKLVESRGRYKKGS